MRRLGLAPALRALAGRAAAERFLVFLAAPRAFFFLAEAAFLFLPATAFATADLTFLTLAATFLTRELLRARLFFAALDFTLRAFAFLATDEAALALRAFLFLMDELPSAELFAAAFLLLDFLALEAEALTFFFVDFRSFTIFFSCIAER